MQVFVYFCPELPRPCIRWMGLLMLAFVMTACGGGGGSDGGSSSGSSSSGSSSSSSSSGSPTTGDDARRAVLRDIGEEIILPALRDFDSKASALEAAADTLAATPNDTEVLEAARVAWEEAMTSWQRNEVLQVGPAGRSTNPDMVTGGQDFREFIYSWPVTLDKCGVEAAANSGAAVDASTPINIAGLGAVEHLLFTSAPPEECAAQPDAAERAVHVQKLAARLAVLATSLRNRWEPAEDNFVEHWSTAGLDTSTFYMRPQDALNSLSIALFYVEKISKDHKIAHTTGVGATGLTCGNPDSCPEFLESRLSQHSGANLIANVQVFRDVFTGVNDQLGINDLLEGIDRADLATEIVTELDVVLAQLQEIEEEIESGEGFDTAVENITDRDECINAFSSSSGLPPCALLGQIKTAMDTFRGPIVSALSLAVPSGAAGDND